MSSHASSLNSARGPLTLSSANDEYSDTRNLLRPLDSQIHLRPLSFTESGQPNQENADRASVKSFETYNSTTSGRSISKIKNFIRRRPLPRYLKGSVRRHAAAEIEPARIGRGLWKDQLLSDRSFRTMAATMTVFAFAMIVLIACYAKQISNRANVNTSSVRNVLVRSSPHAIFILTTNL
jgi:hypothetical protein